MSVFKSPGASVQPAEVGEERDPARLSLLAPGAVQPQDELGVLPHRVGVPPGGVDDGLAAEEPENHRLMFESMG